MGIGRKRGRRMITLLLWVIINLFIFQLDPNVMTENTQIIIITICIASDLNLLTTLMNRK